MFDPSPMNEEEIATLAVLHRQSLPGSVLSWLGVGYLRAFYRYVQRSNLEALVVHRDEGGIAGAAVIAWQPSRLTRRLLLRTPMLAYLALRAPWVATRLFRRRRLLAKAGSTAPIVVSTDLLQAPEVVHFFTTPDRRGHGCGAVLLLKCERLLRSLGEPRYWLKTEDASDNRALNFYRRNGLSPIGTIVASEVRFVVLAKHVDGV